MNSPPKAFSTGLARALSKLGYCSRASARQLVEGGKVQVNGRVVRQPAAPVSLGKDQITVSGQAVSQAARLYLMLNKPRGIVTTAGDEKGRPTVYSLLSGYQQWLAPVGRLDKASEGLLLITNDSEWAAKVASPETHLEKTYHVQIGAIADETLLNSLRSGVVVDGDLLKIKHVSLLRQGQKNCWLEVVLDEGKNRQIRRMLAASGIEVLRLVRTAVGPLHLRDLPKGGSRELAIEEKRELDACLERSAGGASGTAPLH